MNAIMPKIAMAIQTFTSHNFFSTTFNESFQEYPDFTWIYLLMMACWTEYGLP